MQELVISILLMAVIIMAAIVLIFVGSRKGGMTRKQRIMMIRILFPQRYLIRLTIIYSHLRGGGFVLRVI